MNNRHLHSRPHLSPLVLALACAGLVTGCGGGGGGSNDDTGTAPTPTPTVLSVTGTVATGGAVAGAAVDVKCATGSGSATSATDGSYSVSINAGVLPCVARATKDSLVLHGAAAGSGVSPSNSTRINLTPLTQLIVAQVALAEPASYYGGFGSATGLTLASLSTAQSAVVAKLKAGGVDFGTVGEASGGPLVAKTASTAGDAYDQRLEQLQTALSAAGTSVAALTTAYAIEAAGSVAATPATGIVAVPSDRLLQPAASNCGALRSGAYHLFEPIRGGVPLDRQTSSFVVDARTLTVTNPDEVGSGGVQLVANGACDFGLSADADARLLVAPSGLVVTRSKDDSGNQIVAVGIPKQSHTLAELAGDWNSMGLNATGSSYTGGAASLRIADNGALTLSLDCENTSSWSIKTADCAALTGGAADGGVLRANAAGGFDLADSATAAARMRLFAFRAGNGDLMLAFVNTEGGFGFLTRPRSNALPAVGSVSPNWNVIINQNLLSPSAITAGGNTVTSVDAASSSYLRQAGSVGQSTTRPETVFINSPRNGYNTRQAGTVTNSAGGTETVGEWTVLALRGMGLSPLIVPGNKTFVLAVTRP